MLVVDFGSPTLLNNNFNNKTKLTFVFYNEKLWLVMKIKVPYKNDLRKSQSIIVLIISKKELSLIYY